ncbi:MAG: hypothetical protein DYG94_12535 [Leptolyngbya sp. PLA3]|nr:MAG: hypothetical protein EDM82_12920 [Cyanobacteria bacterium CYA]MCE7969553.1 hypothetical protein [Leptolyngbya sp. PL-A3]
MVAFASGCCGQLAVISSIDPPEGVAINSIGLNRATPEVFLHFHHSAPAHISTRSGNLLRTIPTPSGVGGNDDDIEFADYSVRISGVDVPDKSTLAIENHDDPPRIVAAHAGDEALIVSRAFDAVAIGAWTGVAYHHTRHTFFCSDWSGDVVQEVDADSGLKTLTWRASASHRWPASRSMTAAGRRGYAAGTGPTLSSPALSRSRGDLVLMLNWKSRTGCSISLTFGDSSCASAPRIRRRT